jgi:hypothetical protein
MDKKTKPDSCHCSDPKPGGTCCDLICFERPNYFCGHLLTDTDLSLAQQYSIEKHKLHNRTLHGWGVVCGLRLTCDAQCGGVMIDSGYAIDDCGNDLVVCEPQRFDVLAKLREHKYLFDDLMYDPCKPKEEPPKCEDRRCFYIVACYDENATNFTTPFVAGCRPSLTECEPTRICEGVRFDILEELPPEHSWLEDLKRRLEGCFCIFTRGSFAQTLTTNKQRLEGILSSPQGLSATNHSSYNDLFCQLRGLFLLYLKQHPDKYNCKIDDEIIKTALPDPQAQSNTYGTDVRDAFCDLLRLAWQYAISCALGELVPRCPPAKHAGCVVLGTVELEGGCIVHVCNCPRKYVWSFANFFQVLIATAFGGLACEECEEDNEGEANDPASTVGAVNNSRTGDDDCVEHKRHVCCAEIPFDCDWFLKIMSANRWSLNYAGTAAMRAFGDLGRSVRSAFNFARPQTFSPDILRNMSVESAQAELTNLGISRSIAEPAPVEAELASTIESLARLGLATPEHTVVLREKDGIVVDAYAYAPSVFTTGGEQQGIEVAVKSAEAAASSANRRAGEIERSLSARIGDLETKMRVILTGDEGKLAEMRQRIKEGLEAGEKKESQRKKTQTRRKGSRKGEGGANG